MFRSSWARNYWCKQLNYCKWVYSINNLTFQIVTFCFLFKNFTGDFFLTFKSLLRGKCFCLKSFSIVPIVCRRKFNSTPSGLFTFFTCLMTSRAKFICSKYLLCFVCNLSCPMTKNSLLLGILVFCNSTLILIE